MKTVAENEYYLLAVDQFRNRIYFTIIGYWRSRTVVPKYLEDMKRATREVSKGFTILTDLTKMKAPPTEVSSLHTEAQKILVAAGLSRTAEVIGRDAITKLSVDRISRESGMLKGTFSDWKEAEDWLDKPSPR